VRRDGREREVRTTDIVQTERLTIKQTSTGYWVVQQGPVDLAGAMTRTAAEAERDLRNRLRNRSLRRVSRTPAQTRRLAGSPPNAVHR
jgi:hypothetical protein